MTTNEPTNFPTETPTFYPEPTSYSTQLPVNTTSSQNSEIGHQVLWIFLGSVGAGIVAFATCVAGILLKNKCLKDFQNFKQGSEPSWLCEWINREKYDEFRESQKRQSPGNGQRDVGSLGGKDDDHSHNPHTHIEMIFTLGSSTVHTTIDTNSPESALDILARQTLQRSRENMAMGVQAPNTDQEETGSVASAEHVALEVIGTNQTYDI